MSKQTERAGVESCNYRCRSDFVLFRLVDRGSVGSIATPQISQQGKERIVLAIGPDVEDLNVGDRVLVIGSVGSDVVPLPNESGIYMTRQANVALVVIGDDE